MKQLVRRIANSANSADVSVPPFVVYSVLVCNLILLFCCLRICLYLCHYGFVCLLCCFWYTLFAQLVGSWHPLLFFEMPPCLLSERNWTR